MLQIRTQVLVLANQVILSSELALSCLFESQSHWMKHQGWASRRCFYQLKTRRLQTRGKLSRMTKAKSVQRDNSEKPRKDGHMGRGGECHPSIQSPSLQLGSKGSRRKLECEHTAQKGLHSPGKSIRHFQRIRESLFLSQPLFTWSLASH